LQYSGLECDKKTKERLLPQPPVLVIDIFCHILKIVKHPERVLPEFLHHRPERAAPEVDQLPVPVQNPRIDQVPDMVVDPGRRDPEIGCNPFDRQPFVSGLVLEQRDNHLGRHPVGIPALADPETVEEPVDLFLVIGPSGPVDLTDHNLSDHSFEISIVPEIIYTFSQRTKKSLNDFYNFHNF